MLTSITILIPSLGIRTEWISAGACLILLTDTMVYLVNSRKHMFTYRRKEIKHKWKNEKVFGSDHDNKVSRYRILRDITAKNLKAQYPTRPALRDASSACSMM